MRNGVATKRRRKNMNLSEAVFGKLELRKRAQERKVKFSIGWDNFFSIMMQEIDRLKKVEAAR